MRRALILAGALGAAVLVGGCNVSLQSLPKYSSMKGPFYTVRATFSDVLNLPAEAQVREGVATIGQVAAITAHDFSAVVTLQIQEGVHLPLGTRAMVQFDDPLGNEYIEMVPPTRPPKGYLANGATLTEAQTGAAPSVTDTMAALSTVLNGGGINQLHTIISQLDLTLNGNQPQIRDLIAKVEATFGSLAAHSADIDAAIRAVAAMATQLEAGQPQIVAGIDALAPAAGVLAAENTQLRQLLSSVNRLAGVADGIVNTSSRNTVNDIEALLPVVDQLVGVDRQLGPALAALSRFEALTPKVAPGSSLQISLSATAAFGTSATADLRGLPTNGPAVLLEAALP
ncbi:MAG: MCE family protein [Actinomycetota bacterium]|jgi:phospholipid/cholesterol/gamma-HCH transport system substrate-binding protein|nr:MCE family protein [Actinomycetota bacterium]